MISMRRGMGCGQVRLLGALTATVVATAGCGGGGGGGGDSVPPPVTYTPTELKTVAASGVAVAFRTVDAAAGIAELGSVLEGMSVNASGAGTQVLPAAPCPGGGTIASTFTKPTAHTGLRAGDLVAIVFTRCRTGDFVLDGPAKVTAKSTVALPFSNTFNASFDADLTGYSMTHGSVTVAYTGTVTANSTASFSTDAFNVKGAVPSGANLAVSITGAPPISRLVYPAGATFDITGSLTNQPSSLKVDGNIDFTTSAATGSMTIATTTPITGPVPAPNALFVPTAGAISVRQTARNGLAVNLPATAATVSGNTVTISGDADLNGSLETVFTATWADLTTP